MQLNHYNSKFKQQLFPLTVVADNINNAPNIGSLFRTCDAFGVHQLVLCGGNIELGRKMTKTSRSTEKNVNFSIEENALTVVKELKQKGAKIIGLEITSKSISVQNLDVRKEKNLVIIVGSEKFGISEQLLELCDEVVHIDMFGQNSSMNAVQATSIALYEITKQLSS
ncbi:MAG: RNA methyltransferase [Bacteroidetes bacterium MedPE-SWsnd-G2]|nr:MAG: RNA methyltransferase [Bacteroidetes bacterium MedPE-SWsnd-G2]